MDARIAVLIGTLLLIGGAIAVGMWRHRARREPAPTPAPHYGTSVAASSNGTSNPATMNVTGVVPPGTAMRTYTSGPSTYSGLLVSPEPQEPEDER